MIWPLFNLPTFGNRDLDFVSLNFVDFISFNVEQCFCASAIVVEYDSKCTVHIHVLVHVFQDLANYIDH
ncbi:hypothetical protein DERP_005070 [Dermatophagoides pteronyssinus]|uniref:Uncharacterized protein n=1 Tax=Dermatophagoides pteronyssinus TaxID=6956 RepID=A0ABQ8JTE0_DERPT|nr:hypothetical protein DERP_005070 [Dermatophagoides pteronyssinus]